MKYKRLIIATMLIAFFPCQVFGLTLSDEKKYGKEIFLEIAKSGVFYRDPYLSLYFEGIKKRLESVSIMPYPVTLTIIRSPEINAFATMGGYVYVTTALIEFTETEEELAGVISHEIAHVERRHIAKRMEQQKYLTAAMLGTMLLSALAGAPAVQSAILTTGTASAQALALKYSRDDEEEADSFGTKIASRAGYGGIAVAKFLKRMRMAGVDKTLPQYLLTHPYPDERIARIESLWSEKTISIDTSFYPYIIARINVLTKSPQSATQDIWSKRYAKNPRDNVAAYGFALLSMLKGDFTTAIRVAGKLEPPYRNLLLGEILYTAKNYREAIAILENMESPIARFFLAKSYEGSGSISEAINVFKNLLPYGKAYPEIYYNLGMLTGRMGNEARGYELLGKFYIETGKYELARINIEKAIAKYGINTEEGKALLAVLDELKS